MFRDDRGKQLRFSTAPRRIVSLVPSDTLTLFELGAGERLIGRTRYCVEPSAAVSAIPDVGGTKDPDVAQIIALAPDLVIANQEENSRASIEALDRAGLAVLVSFPRTVAQGLAHAARLARVLGLEKSAEGATARRALADAYATLREAEKRAEDKPLLAAFVPIWMDPLMTANEETFLSDALRLAGGKNIFGDRPRRYPLSADLGLAPPSPAERTEGKDTRYPRVTVEEIIARAPEIVLLPDEPHAFTEADAEVFRALPIPAARRGAVLFCDGKDLLWYGLRAVQGLRRLRTKIDALRVDLPAS